MRKTVDSYKREQDRYEEIKRLIAQRERTELIRTTVFWSVWVTIAMAALAMIMLSGGCAPTGYVKAEAIEGTVARICSRHNTYTLKDESLSDAKKRTNLRDAELVLQALKEARNAGE